jgi:hypothetical protein
LFNNSTSKFFFQNNDNDNETIIDEDENGIEKFTLKDSPEQIRLLIEEEELSTEKYFYNFLNSSCSVSYADTIRLCKNMECVSIMDDNNKKKQYCTPSCKTRENNHNKTDSKFLLYYN